MEIIYKGNKHNAPKPEQIYGCKCDNCGSAFTFADHEVNKPRTPFFFDKDCSITCPVCGRIITLDKCEKFKDASEEVKFKLTHEQSKIENN